MDRAPGHPFFLSYPLTAFPLLCLRHEWIEPNIAATVVAARPIATVVVNAICRRFGFLVQAWLSALNLAANLAHYSESANQRYRVRRSIPRMSAVLTLLQRVLR